ncbi:MAG: hypothetical protein CVU50_04755 [Candidatus Cloacimonetes bacterium HGW-Cloacimonetes-3]|nr:MAG: hypothetical protein CVU50_04755 [Candidatus Cloacimonetes bacterium HGW-Cloacimonetes-3]
MKKLIMILIAMMVVVQLLSLVAFNGFNQRNHPELDWKSIETANCRIVYHEPLLEQARSSAVIAQKTFVTLSKTYQISPKQTCIIYISDQDNIPNGAALLSHYIFIWVNQNDFTGLFTGNDKWLRKVISHEMSHWFLAASISGWLTKYIPIYPTFPRNLNEGYAQFFSGETWGYNRGDRFLKASVLSNKSGIPSAQYDGGLLYADGFAKVRYLSAMYGEEKLIKLLKYRNKAKFYGFKEAFKEVYKKDYSAFEGEWRRYINTYYFGEVYANKAVPADTTAAGNINDFAKLSNGYYQFANLDWKQDKLLFAAKDTENQNYYDLILSTVKMDSLKADKLELKSSKRLFKASRFTKISLSENGKWAAWSVYTRHKAGRLAPRIFRYDVTKGKLQRLEEGNYPEMDSLGGVYYQKLGANSNDIWYDIAEAEEHPTKAKSGKKPQGTIVYSLGFDEQIGNLSLSPDNTKLAFIVFDKDAAFNISVLDINTRQVTDKLSLTDMAQSIRWNNDHELLYSTENPESSDLDVVIYNLNDKAKLYLAHPPYNAEPIRYLDDKMYVMADMNRGARIPGSYVPKLKPAVKDTFTENYYNKWIKLMPQYSITDSTKHIEISQPQDYVSWRNIKWRMGFVLPTYTYASGGFVLSEALGKHLFAAFAALPYSPKDRAWWIVMYQNKTLSPTLDLNYTRDQWLSGIGEDKLYYQDMERVSGKISFPFNIVKPYRGASLGFDISYTDLTNANDNPIYKNKGFASFGAKAGYSYSLPWKNMELHPVRSYDADYSLQMASETLGMNMDFNQHSFQAGFAYAPLLEIAGGEMMRTITLQNRSHYEIVNGDPLTQFLPGTNRYEILQSGNRPAFKRYYLRGYEDDYLCKKLLNVQSELNIKLSDDINLNVLSDMLSIHYAGFTLWHDYTALDNILQSDRKSRTYNANGFELRAETNFLMLPAVLKFGTAYDMDFKKLSDYFLIEIPFLQMLQDSM